MFEKLFKRKPQQDDYDPTNVIPTVPEAHEVAITVPNLKSYLVEEFERVQALELKLESAEEKVKEMHSIRKERDALLVLVDEHKRRIGACEEKLRVKDDALNEQDRVMREVEDELNTYKIKLNKIVFRYEDMDQLYKAVEQLKGNLSKKQILDMIKGER